MVIVVILDLEDQMTWSFHVDGVIGDIRYYLSIEVVLLKTKDTIFL